MRKNKIIELLLIVNQFYSIVFLCPLQYVGPRIHSGMNPFILQVSKRQRAIRAAPIFITQVINVANCYLKCNKKHKRLTLSL